MHVIFCCQECIEMFHHLDTTWVHGREQSTRLTMILAARSTTQTGTTGRVGGCDAGKHRECCCDSGGIKRVIAVEH